MKIAIVSTVHNRKNKTEKAIQSLAIALKNYEYRFYFCDDGSTDGTRERLYRLPYPITVLEGNGNLFWSRGMYCAMKKASEDGADIYLLVNDDVEFYPDAINIMLSSYKSANKHCGIVGSTISLKNGNITYGGRILNESQLIKPNGSLQLCDLANWNCFLIDDFIVKNVGLIDNYYEHALGDYDYSLRMKAQGIPIYIAKEYVGSCENNEKKGTYHDKNTPRKHRFKSMFSRRNMPLKSRWHFYMGNFGVKGLKGFLWPYIKCSICILARKDY